MLEDYEDAADEMEEVPDIPDSATLEGDAIQSEVDGLHANTVRSSRTSNSELEIEVDAVTLELDGFTKEQIKTLNKLCSDLYKSALRKNKLLDVSFIKRDQSPSKGNKLSGESTKTLTIKSQDINELTQLQKRKIETQPEQNPTLTSLNKMSSINLTEHPIYVMIQNGYTCNPLIARLKKPIKLSFGMYGLTED